MPKFTAVDRDAYATKVWRRPTDFRFVSHDTVAPVVLAEAAVAAQSMPLAFLEQSGQYFLVAVLSFAPNTNLFVTPSGKWLGRYVPACYRFAPFRLMQIEASTDAVLCIDEESGLLANQGEIGEPFFDPSGELSQPLKEVVDFLQQLNASQQATARAIDALARAEVIKEWPLSVATQQGPKRLSGLYGVDEKAFNDLTDEQFLDLRKTGALVLAYVQMFSTGQTWVLGELARLQAAAQDTQSKATSPQMGFQLSDDTIRFE